MTSFPLHHCPFFLCRGQQAGSIDEFSGAAVFCLNKALFSTPRALAQRPNPYQASTRGSLPVVPGCCHTGFWELAGLRCLCNFSSGIHLSPGELSQRNIALRSFALERARKVEKTQSAHFPFCLLSTGQLAKVARGRVSAPR